VEKLSVETQPLIPQTVTQTLNIEKLQRWIKEQFRKREWENNEREWSFAIRNTTAIPSLSRGGDKTREVSFTLRGVYS
jgi:hypothetical protein